jgi:hypothetical protein
VQLTGAPQVVATIGLPADPKEDAYWAVFARLVAWNNDRQDGQNVTAQIISGLAAPPPVADQVVVRIPGKGGVFMQTLSLQCVLLVPSSMDGSGPILPGVELQCWGDNIQALSMSMIAISAVLGYVE